MKSNFKAQDGVILIEALVGMLIFLIGILALMGMQATAISNTSQAKYRSDASQFAGQMLSQMWLDPNNIASYNYSGGSSPSAMVNGWVARIAATLPGTSATTNPPRVTSVCATDSSLKYACDVTVIVYWIAPNETGAPHNFTTASRIAFN